MKTLLFIVLLMILPQAYATSLDTSCAASFPIDQEKKVSIEYWGGEPLACVDIDQIRNTLYETLSKEDYSYVIKNIEFSESQLKKIQNDLNSNGYTSEHISLGISVVTYPIAVIGLANCLETLGGGCLVAGIAYGAEWYNRYQALNGYADKSDEISKLIRQLEKAKGELERHKNQLPTKYEEAIKKFNHMCQIIREKCIEDL